MQSILTNEKYKGDALLQKTFTVDFLQKKMKANEGEIPQYYVENSHPPIIEPEEWNYVQMEMARRKALGRAYSGKSVLSTNQSYLFTKKNISMLIKSYEFVRQYFSDKNKLLEAIKTHKSKSKISKNEVSLIDIIKESP